MLPDERKHPHYKWETGPKFQKIKLWALLDASVVGNRELCKFRLIRRICQYIHIFWIFEKTRLRNQKVEFTGGTGKKAWGIQPHRYFTVMIFYSLSHVFHVRNVAFHLQNCFHALLGFSLCLFFTKNHHADILIPSKHSRAVVHSLDTVIFETRHHSPFGIKFCSQWALITSSHPLLLARSSALCIEATGSQQFRLTRYLSLFWYILGEEKCHHNSCFR